MTDLSIVYLVFFGGCIVGVLIAMGMLFRYLRCRAWTKKNERCKNRRTDGVKLPDYCPTHRRMKK